MKRVYTLNEREFRRLVNSEAKRLIENKFRRTRSRLFEDASPEKINLDMFPNKLRSVNAKLAAALAKGGAADGDATDDVMQAGSVTKAAKDFHASQTTMDLEKFVGMAIQMFGKTGGFPGGPGGDLSAIVSGDNYIMDGHHRWAATLLVDPAAEMTGLQVSEPGRQLVGVLNVWTVSKGQGGKPSTHKMSDLTPDLIAETLIRLATNGGNKLPSPEAILEGFKKNGIESVQEAADIAKKNWEATANCRKKEDWMPEKIDMPAIDPEQLKDVMNDVSKGVMDVNPPYSEEVKTAAAAANISLEGKRYFVTERWQRLAGILKG